MTSPLQSLIAYYRVSTERQGQSGLGFDAQRFAVATYTVGRDLLDDFGEAESRRKDNRPHLGLVPPAAGGSGSCQAGPRGRWVAFISNLMESGAEFIAVDMPQANRLTLHILAAVTEHERGMISQGTRAALAAAKAK